MAIAPRDVLGFWFSPESQPKWFVKDPDFDSEIRVRFEQAWRDGLEGRLIAWEEQPESTLALIVLLDQFPRNMFRGTAESFASDAAALAVAERALAKGFEKSFGPDRRRFFYLPFEHAEDLDAQRRCVGYLEANGDDPDGLDYARRHLVIIERFGRFPHRNALLGRPSTPEEVAFLKEPGSSF